MKDLGLWLQISKRLAETRLRELEDYAKALESLLGHQAQEVGDELDREAAKLAAEDRSEFYADNAEYYQSLSGHFPNRLRLSLVTAAHAALEGQVVSTCKMLQRAKGASLSLSDISGGSLIKRAKKYITQLMNVQIDESVWSPLAPYTKIRHIVAHSDGFCAANDKKKIAHFVSTNEALVSFDNFDNLVATEKLLAAYLTEIRAFYSTLFAAISDWGKVRAV